MSPAVPEGASAAPISPRLIRVGFAVLGAVSAQIGLWAFLAPQSFYDQFPGFGRTWVAVDGPYNEHLIRDVGALNIAITVLIAVAAVTLTSSLVTMASVVALVWGTLHLAYHVTHTEVLSGSDLIGSFAGLIVFVAIPAVILVQSYARSRMRPDDQASQRSHVGSAQ